MNIQPKKRIIVRKKKLDPYQRGYMEAQRRMSAFSSDQQESSPGCLCFFLGALLGPIGVVVAAIIGKADGVKAALFGLLLDIGAAVVVWLAIILVAVRAG